MVGSKCFLPGPTKMISLGERKLNGKEFFFLIDKNAHVFFFFFSYLFFLLILGLSVLVFFFFFFFN